MRQHIFFAKNSIPDKQSITLQDTDTSDTTSEEVELPIDMFRSGNKIIVKAPIVGAGLHDISVTINDQRLTIHKNSFREEADEREHYYLQECHWGTLSRTIDLPKEVDPDRTRATLNDGILTIMLPLATNSHTKIIKIKE